MARKSNKVFLFLITAGIGLGCGSGKDPAPAGGSGGGGSGGSDPGGPIPANGWGDGVSLMSDGKPITFYPALAGAWMGDWQGTGSYVAQVFPVVGGGYQANLLTAFDSPSDAPIAVLTGTAAGETISWSGAGWTGTTKDGHLTAQSGSESLDLEHVTRASPTLGAAPPAGAIVLFDGTNLDAWAKKNATNWLQADGPPAWKLVDGGAVEVVPGTDSLITKQTFGSYKAHVEFRTLGTPTNSGVFLQARYESNINEIYGHFDGNATAGFDNCTPAAMKLKVRASRPPLAWQTLDIDFHAPQIRRGGDQNRTGHGHRRFQRHAIYDAAPLDLPTGAAGRFGEAATGPLMLQEHGMPLQFRNIWLIEASP